MLKDVLAIAVFVVWLAANGWLWASDVPPEKLFVRSLLLAIPGYGGFFGYLAYRHRNP